MLGLAPPLLLRRCKPALSHLLAIFITAWANNSHVNASQAQLAAMQGGLDYKTTDVQIHHHATFPRQSNGVHMPCMTQRKGTQGRAGTNPTAVPFSPSARFLLCPGPDRELRARGPPFRFLRSFEVIRLSLCGAEAPARCLLLHLLALPVLDCAILASSAGPRRPARAPLCRHTRRVHPVHQPQVRVSAVKAEAGPQVPLRRGFPSYASSVPLLAGKQLCTSSIAEEHALCCCS